MKTFLRTLVALGAVVLAFVAGPAAMAQCNDFTPFLNALGGSLTELPEAWVGGLTSQVGGGANSGSSPFICTSNPTPGIEFCQEASSADNVVTISGDWFNQGIIGCPVTYSDPTGSAPIVTAVTSSENEGTASHTGKYVIMSVGWWQYGLWYAIDAADPAIGSTGGGGPLGAGNIPSPHVDSLIAGVGTAEVKISWSAATSYDDCTYNPLGSCTDFPGGSRPVGIDYVLYQHIGACNAEPTTSLPGLVWTPRSRCDFPGDPDCTSTSGRINVAFDSSGTNCTYLALGIQVNGFAPTAVSGHVSVGTSDSDGDGYPDTTDNCPQDFNDQTDSDGDLIGDECDNCPVDPNQDQIDGDSDGIGVVCDNCPGVNNPGQEDGESDGIGDACDACPLVPDTGADGDFDGIPDACDNCPNNSNLNQSDADLDGVGDACDNCPAVDNPGQEDSELGGGDGRGDLCDNCPTKLNFDQFDTDFDTVGDACDNCVGIPNPGQEDTGGDERGDACTELVQEAVINVQLNGGIVTWETTTEVTVAGFNLLWIRNGKEFLANPVQIPCTQCFTGLGDVYAYPIPKHKTSRNLWVQMITADGEFLFGPATYSH
jgi:hypothetical protein